MTSLEIVNELIYKCNDFLGDCITCISKENLEQIKQELEVLKLIIKWKNNIYLRYDFEYLDNEESIIMQSELKLIENYLAHHFGYIPKCFNKVGDNS